MVMVTVNQNGIPNSSKSRSCNTLATKNKRNAAPIVLDSKKNEAPVLYEYLPNLSSIGVYRGKI